MCKTELENVLILRIELRKRLAAAQKEYTKHSENSKRLWELIQDRSIANPVISEYFNAQNSASMWGRLHYWDGARNRTTG